MNYYQVNVSYDRQTGEDNPGKVKEAYLVATENASDAENRVMEEIKPFIFGECETKQIKKRSFFNEFINNECNDYYYEAKVEMITIEGETETRKAVSILVSAGDFKDALLYLMLGTNCYDCEIISLKKSPITDILAVTKSE